MTGRGLVERYVELGLRAGRHVPGFVDAYYGPPAIRKRAESAPLPSPDELLSEARGILAALDAGEPLDHTGPGGGDASRRRWLRSQIVGVLTSCRILAGDPVGYEEEVERCYGVRPQRTDEERFLTAHRALEEVVPGSGPLAERFIAWREAQAVSEEQLEPAIRSLAEDLRDRTAKGFGLPEGEEVEFVFVRNEPWSGFNYYLGDLRSRVAINLDLPVLSTSLAHLVAHEAYPGHHTEHSRKEVGLYRRRSYLEESLFLVGTPQCLLAEGLADLGLEVVMGRRPEHLVAEHLRPLHIPYDPDVVAVIAEASETLANVRANAAFRLHVDGAEPAVVTEEVMRFGLLPRARAAKSVEFLTDPTWRSYVSCYVEGLPLCRRYVGGRLERFARLITEQCLPEDLAAA